MKVSKLDGRQWKKDSGYHPQARVENTFFRYTSTIGGEPSSAQSRGAGD